MGGKGRAQGQRRSQVVGDAHTGKQAVGAPAGAHPGGQELLRNSLLHAALEQGQTTLLKLVEGRAQRVDVVDTDRL